VTCPEALRTQAYFDDEVDAPTAVVVEGHLEGCGECQALLGDLARARDEVRRAFALAPEAGLLGRIRRAVDAEAARTTARAPGERRAWRPRSFWSGAFGGALIGATAVALLTFRLRSRMSAIVNELLFSTSTFPSRSNSTPRGARSGIVRRKLLSAISLYLSCSKTCRTQKPPASARKAMDAMTRITTSRICSPRRSSMVPGVTITSSFGSGSSGGPSGLAPGRRAALHRLETR